MRNNLSIILLTTVLFFSYNSFGQKKEILGYVPAYRTVYDTAHWWNKVTIMALSFARVQDGGALNVTDIQKKFGDIVAKSHEHGIRVIVSITHESGNKLSFSKAIVDKTQRDRIVSDVMALVVSMNLDGVDVDFESWDETNATNAEKTAGLSELLKDLRKQLSENQILTAAFTMSALGKGYYTPSMLQCLDYMNVMTYDKTGPWGSVVGPHAPYSYFLEGINRLVQMGVEKRKILPGIPFYGIRFPSAPYTTGSYQMMYKNILKNYPGAENSNIISSENLYYDGINDVIQKTEYVKNENIGGVMIWELTQDYYEDTDKSLLFAIHAGLSGTGSVASNFSVSSSNAKTNMICVPLDTKYFRFETNVDKASVVKVELISLDGQSKTLYNQNALGKLEVHFRVKQSGVYCIRMTQDAEYSGILKLIIL